MVDKSKLETVDCNICGSKEYEVIYKSEYEKATQTDEKVLYRASGDEPLLDQLVKCKKCNLVYVNPRLKPEVILGGYSEGEDEMFVSQSEAREATFFSALKTIEKYKKEKGKILDIGTAGGAFLAAAKKRGWDIYGCEPNKWMAEWGEKNLGINIDLGTLFEQKYHDKSFDVVTLWDVVEHTTEPSKILAECRRILKDDGLLVINYPDWGSWIAKIMKKKWFFTLAVHLFYFTPETIKKLMNKCGFQIIKMKPHFQKLETGYLFFRMGAYSKLLSKFGGTTAKLLHINHWKIPYWIGQTFVVAGKNENQ